MYVAITPVAADILWYLIYAYICAYISNSTYRNAEQEKKGTYRNAKEKLQD